MSKKQRICLEEATYHARSRCLEWQTMISEESFKKLLGEVLESSQRVYSYDLIFHEVENTLISLVIKTKKGEASISRIMQYIKSRFAERFNRTVGRFGPFWFERFKDTIVEFEGEPWEEKNHTMRAS